MYIYINIICIIYLYLSIYLYTYISNFIYILTYIFIKLIYTDICMYIYIRENWKIIIFEGIFYFYIGRNFICNHWLLF